MSQGFYFCPYNGSQCGNLYPLSCAPHLSQTKKVTKLYSQRVNKRAWCGGGDAASSVSVGRSVWAAAGNVIPLLTVKRPIVTLREQGYYRTNHCTEKKKKTFTGYCAKCSFSA